MTQGKRKTWVIGHKNPDTDSICAAIAYADLKNQTEDGIFIPKRAGHMNEETKYVLKFFDVPEPELVTDVGAQIKDIEYRRTEGVSSHISIKRAWELMKNLDVVSLLTMRTICREWLLPVILQNPIWMYWTTGFLQLPGRSIRILLKL